MTSEKDCYCDGDCDCTPCKVCGESWTANADRLCRDCHINKLFEDWPRCGCGRLLVNAPYLTQTHEPTCPHEERGTFGAT